MVCAFKHMNDDQDAPRSALHGYRTITAHHDGHGLNESIAITADPVDGSGASHDYTFAIDRDTRARVQFQQGPRNVNGSIAGVTEAAILAMLIDRLEGFQAGPYSCQENDQQLAHLRAALALTKRRADARAARGVLGKNEK